MTKPMPSKAALEAEYATAASKADLAKLYSVSERTVDRWFHRLEIESRPANGSSVVAERRTGGRPYKATQKRPQHVSPELAKTMREIKQAHPELSISAVKERSGARCSRQMVALVLKGERCISPESFPAPAPKKAAALVSFGSVDLKRG